MRCAWCRWLLALALAGTALVARVPVGGAVAAGPCYRFAALPMPAGDVNAFAYDINDAGVIVGGSARPGEGLRPVRWGAEGVEELGRGRWTGLLGLRVNDGGDVVGTGFLPPGEDPRAPRGWAARYADGGWSDFPLAAGAPRLALGVNARGQVLGLADRGGEIWTVLWEDGHSTPVMERAEGVGAALNDAGAVAGNGPGPRSSPFLWRDGVRTELGLPEGMAGAAVAGLNDAGAVLVVAITSIGWPYAYLWADGAWRPVDPDGLFTLAPAFNDRGDVVGNAATLATLAHSLPTRPALWDGDGRHDLTEATACTGGVPQGLVLRAVSAINNHGQIVGWALGVGGFEVPFLLDPVPG